MLDNPGKETGELISGRNIRNRALTFLIVGYETTRDAVVRLALPVDRSEPSTGSGRKSSRCSVRTAHRCTVRMVATRRYIRRIIDENAAPLAVRPGIYRKARQETSCTAARSDTRIKS